MIITRTPLRISIGGGGTDLPSYYERFGGLVISAAIDKYVYITSNRTFRPGYLLKYANTEHVQTIDEVEHGILREVLRLLDIEPAIEIVSIADVPAGTGLGSSGSFTVGLLHALHAYNRIRIGAGELARMACEVEMTILGEPCGKQDPYIAAHGGIMIQEFQLDGNVVMTPLQLCADTLRDLDENLLLFFTGYSRTAHDLLDDQKTRSEKGDADMLENLHFIKDQGMKIRQALEGGATEEFAGLMHDHWMRKKERSPDMSNDRINGLYDLALQNGALGGKLVGAGGGGFLMFYAGDRASLRRVMAAQGLQEMDFSFDIDGSVVILRA